MKGEQRPNIEQPQAKILTSEETQAVHLFADLRRRAQELEIAVLNLEQLGATDPMKKHYGETIDRVNREIAEKYMKTAVGPEAHREIQLLKIKAKVAAETFPRLAAYFLAQAVKIEIANGIGAEQDIAATKKFLTQVEESGTPKSSPADLLPDAILLGVQKRLLDKLSFPDKEKIARAVLTDRELLADYALVLQEAERPDFLALLPPDIRRQTAIWLDEAVAKVLHQAVVGKETGEYKQRQEVRLRVYKEMRQVLQDSKSTDRKIAGALARAMSRLGGDVRLLLLELARDEMDKNPEAAKEQNYLPHVVGILLKNFDDFRVNDIALQVAGSENAGHYFARNLLFRLIKRGYVPADVGEWWEKRKATAKIEKREKEDEAEKMELARRVISDLSVVPSRDILKFLENEKQWRGINLDERIKQIKESQAEFTQLTTQRELVEFLVGNEHKAMIYFLLHGGDDRFNLINNYSFDKFKKMLKLIADLKIHPEPMEKFKEALRQGGIPESETDLVMGRLLSGHFPLANVEQSYQEVSFEVSENAAVKNANAEIGLALGREQLGVVLLFPLYREYLEKETRTKAQDLVQKMQAAHTFTDRLALISAIESAHPDLQAKAKADLQESWRAFDEKMVLGLSLDQVLNTQNVALRGEELIPRLNSKRADLKRMKKDLLVVLRGENKKLSKLQQELHGKKKARGQLTIGLEKQTDARKQADLKDKISALDKEIANLEAQRIKAYDAKVHERFADLSPAEKEQEVEKISREIVALTEKSPSAIFTYLTMQVLGEERLREQDIQLVQEMESHLQGPFQTIQDNLNYQPTGKGRSEKKNMRVGLHYVDKATRLTHMVRFADSKICCFSSNNYEMRVQHDTPNKYWVASINADPMSFVISMEAPQGDAEAEGNKKKVNENLGFIFGSFALDDNSQLVIMLNGIYYAPGIEDEKQVSAILGKVEKMFQGLPVKRLAVATQYGGSIKMPKEFKNTPINIMRLRALDSGYGQPENRIYDDLGTGDKLNHPKTYNVGGAGSVWHKGL
ncbi:MAG: hypothetical protein HY602_02315 [Parcubacteria group bacterium]|nr:hypothetical protein [Parcubacteria group bacterium]